MRQHKGWLAFNRRTPGWFCAVTLPVHDDPQPIPGWVWDALVV